MPHFRRVPGTRALVAARLGAWSWSELPREVLVTAHWTPPEQVNPPEPENRTSGLGRFAAHLAHEINNPLAGISNAAALLRTVLPPTDPHYQYVAIIEREVARIAEVTRQMCRGLGAEPGPGGGASSGSAAA